jgi:hypothetical protein
MTERKGMLWTAVPTAVTLCQRDSARGQYLSGIWSSCHVDGATFGVKDGRDVRSGDHNMEADPEFGSIGRSE